MWHGGREREERDLNKAMQPLGAGGGGETLHTSNRMQRVNSVDALL